MGTRFCENSDSTVKKLKSGDWKYFYLEELLEYLYGGYVVISY